MRDSQAVEQTFLVAAAIAVVSLLYATAGQAGGTEKDPWNGSIGGWDWVGWDSVPQEGGGISDASLTASVSVHAQLRIVHIEVVR